MTNGPCKNCKDRCIEPNCHTVCRKYLDWKAENDRIREEQYRTNRLFWKRFGKPI